LVDSQSECGVIRGKKPAAEKGKKEKQKEEKRETANSKDREISCVYRIGGMRDEDEERKKMKGRGERKRKIVKFGCLGVVCWMSDFDDEGG
jgi:hypothetical protein